MLLDVSLPKECYFAVRRSPDDIVVPDASTSPCLYKMKSKARPVSSQDASSGRITSLPVIQLDRASLLGVTH